jgi:signal transduction histidine kinase
MFLNIKVDVVVIKHLFFYIHQNLYKISEIDSTIRCNIDLIGRFLIMAEFIIVDNIYRVSPIYRKNSCYRVFMAVRRIQKLFFQSDNIMNSKEEMQKVVEYIKKIFIDILPYDLEQIVISNRDIDSLEYDIVKKVQYKEHKYYFGLKLFHRENRDYLEEILILLMEVVELNFALKEREQSFVDFAKRAEDAVSAKDTFLAFISHEFRTPLTAINGFSQIFMLSKDTPEKIRKYMKIINEEGNSLLNMVNTILDFAKLDAGKVACNQAISGIFSIVKEVEVLMKSMADRKNISLNIYIDENLYLMIDPELFKKVLLNLISNAIKFTPEDGKIYISANYSKKYNEYLFSICDTGIGISKEDQTKLFHSFVQIENIYQKGESGSGLGLMICKKIIEELHYGRIWVESEPDNGSCFYFTIPIKKN